MDLVKYIQGHAYKFYSKLPQDTQKVERDDYLHFYFSIKTPYFLMQNYNIQEKMEELLQELLKPAMYKVKDGKRRLKNGEITQKWAYRKINLNKDVVVWAIHLQDTDGNKTEPHIHFLIKKNARLGRDFSLLKTHIINTLLKHNLIPHFADEKSVKSDKLLQKRVKNFTWEIRKSTNKKLKEAIKKSDFSEKLELLWEYALKGQLQYYAKTMFIFQKRLNYLKEDFIFKGRNLRHIIPVPLNQYEHKAFLTLKNRNFTQKNLKNLKDSKVLDNYYKYCKTGDLQSSYILKLIKNNTNELKNLRKNETFVKNWEKIQTAYLEEKINKLKEYNLQTYNKIQKEDLNIYETLKNDLISIAKTCKNEKELREKMQIYGYKHFGFKKRQGKVIAYKFKLEGKDYIVKCRDSLNISDLRAILKENNIKAQAGQDLHKKVNLLKHKYLVLKKIKKQTKSKQETNKVTINLKNEDKVKKLKNLKKDYKNEYVRTLKAMRKKIRGAEELKQTIIGEIKRTERFDRAIEQTNINTNGLKKRFRERTTKQIGEFKKGVITKIRERITEFREQFKTKIIELIGEFGTRIKERIKEHLEIKKYIQKQLKPSSSPRRRFKL